MFAYWKEKLARRRLQRKSIEESQHWKQDPRLQCFLQAMRGSCTIAPSGMHEAVIAAVNIAIKENLWTRPDEIPDDLFSGTVYVVWDDAHLPVVMVHWNAALERLRDMRSVNPNTFLVAQTMDRILWFNTQDGIKLYSIT